MSENNEIIRSGDSLLPYTEIEFIDKFGVRFKDARRAGNDVSTKIALDNRTPASVLSEMIGFYDESLALNSSIPINLLEMILSKLLREIGYAGQYYEAKKKLLHNILSNDVVPDYLIRNLFEHFCSKWPDEVLLKIIEHKNCPTDVLMMLSESNCAKPKAKAIVVMLKKGIIEDISELDSRIVNQVEVKSIPLQLRVDYPTREDAIIKIMCLENFIDNQRQELNRFARTTEQLYEANDKIKQCDEKIKQYNAIIDHKDSLINSFKNMSLWQFIKLKYR